MVSGKNGIRIERGKLIQPEKSSEHENPEFQRKRGRKKKMKAEIKKLIPWKKEGIEFPFWQKKIGFFKRLYREMQTSFMLMTVYTSVQIFKTPDTSEIFINIHLFCCTAP